MGQYNGAPAISHATDGVITQQQKQLNLIHIFFKILSTLKIHSNHFRVCRTQPCSDISIVLKIYHNFKDVVLVLVIKSNHFSLPIYTDTQQ